MTILGYICIAVAVAWIGYKMYVSFNSAGGTIMVTVYDAAIYPPVLATFGSYAVLKSFGVTWPIWGFLLLWLGLLGVVVGGIKLMEELGDRPL